MTTEDGTGRKGFRFSDAVQAIHSSLRGQATSQQQQPMASHGDSSRQVVINVEQSPSVDSFPHLSLDSLGGILSLGEVERSQVQAAYEEAKLNWDLDPRLVGGQRSDSNVGMARVFGLLSTATLAHRLGDESSRSRGGGGFGTDGEAVAAPDQEGVTWEGESRSMDNAKGAKGTQEVFHRQFEVHDLLRAIDRKDTQTILTIRDANFDLLLDLNQSGGSGGTLSTPLGYCIGLGNGWEGVAIVITGALSKFVNNLPDEEEDVQGGDGQGQEEAVRRKPRRIRRELDPRTMSRLRKLRTSLKLAIDHSIAIDQTRLLSSYLQVLLMSSGQTFIRETVESVHQSLLSFLSGSQVSSSGKIMSNTDPFQVASQAITSFFTDSLKTKSQLKDVSQRIASVDDLINNCVGDFVLMAIWHDIHLHRNELARLDKAEQRQDVENRAQDEELMSELQTWFFARDDRVTTIFLERVWNLEKVLDLIEWQGKGHRSTSATRGPRNARIWHCAKAVVEQFGTQKKRLGSTDRLALLRSILH